MQVTQAMLEVEAKYRARLFQYDPPLYSARASIAEVWPQLGAARDEACRDVRKFAAKVLRHARNIERDMARWESSGAHP